MYIDPIIHENASWENETSTYTDIFLVLLSAYSIHWVPNRLLKKLAENNVPFTQWANHVSKSKM